MWCIDYKKRKSGAYNKFMVFFNTLLLKISEKNDAIEALLFGQAGFLNQNFKEE